ncbi:hypothetical protein RKE30_03615 [Streptomyces sp. Li-HN-5-11]|uniref:hypothetical protein n=1 Tax=Streptomyces sp. Li-HN-5-11 TaxID=3075432 RepID=UPI0028A835ED|nr:hypothetical protein [Streptomyces sp. Li-HN-5-11]WNM29545.1 hypothetical protein RKE30_03615 [Streptomyces sp. Li-HN-5-11]
MGTLEPVGNDVSEESRALAEALRTLFNSLDISMRRYAARCHTDAGTLSRYFNGIRVPPWSFIVNLLTHVAEVRENPTSDETVALLRQLYVRAAGKNAGARRTVDLQRLLEEADEHAREAASLERLLRQALHDSQQQVDQLNVELKTLRAARASDRQAVRAEIEVFTSETDDLRAERDQLQAEIELLKRQLSEAIGARILAEERCDQLERQIEGAEAKEKAEEESEKQQAVPSQEAKTHITTEAFQLTSDQMADHAVREYKAAQEQIAAAQDRIAALQSELEKNRRKRSASHSTDYLAATLSEQRATSDAPHSLAVRLGYGPDQVLRRVDAAHRINPEDVRPILTRAFDLQSKEEIEETRLLLRSMPVRVQEMFVDIVTHSIKGSTSNKKKASGGEKGASGLL